MATESFFSNASLAYLASAGAGKDGKAYSIKPTDGTGDFTFSRGSNLTATRVGPTGLIEKGRENLLLQSNQFDTTWADGGDYTITSSQDGYDGTTDAWLLNKNTTGNDYLRQSSLSTDAVNTFSFYAKEGSLRGVKLVIGGQNVAIDLRDGSTISTGGASNLIAAGADLVSGTTDWYRIYLTKDIATTAVLIKPTDETGADASGSIYIQDAQVEVGTLATDYIESGASTGKAGLLENEPRFDYSGGATCPSLLLEPQRVNQFKYSEYFEFGLSSQSNVTSITTNTTETLSPEGLYNATKGVFASGWNFSDAVTSTVNVQSTTSVYVKAVNPSSNNTFRIFTGGIVSGNLTATSEWKRFDFTATSTGGSICGLFRDSSSNPAELYFYGMQTEVASYPTSYIPNHSGGSATRTGDASMVIPTAAFEFNSLGAGESATIFIELKYIASNNFLDVLSQGGSGTWRWSSNQFFIRTINPTTAPVFDMGEDVTTLVGETIKIAIVKDDANLIMYCNGTLRDTINIGTAELDWCSHISNYLSIKGINKVLGFPEALSQADAITLTTL